MDAKFETEDLDIEGIISGVIDDAGICPDEKTMAAIRLIVKRVKLPYQRDMGVLIESSRYFQEILRQTDQKCKNVSDLLKDLMSK